MPKISQYPDGGALQSTDQLVIARSDVNYSILGSQLGGGVNQNVLINGGMRVAQRGAGPFTSVSTFVNNDDSYLIDGVVFLANGTDTCDVSQVADADFVSGYKIRLDVETANRRFGILLPVENRDIQTIRKEGTASLQFKVKCTGTSMSNVRAYLLAWNSTADTITSDVISAWGSAGADPTFVANWTAENTASNLAVTTTIATHQIQNITVDTANVTNLAVLIIVDDTDATVGDFLEIGDVKLEHGSSCTDYVNPLYNDELQRCMRRFIYYTLGAGNTIGSGYAGGAGTSAVIAVYTPVPLASTPTLISGAASEYTVRADGLSNVATAIAFTAYRTNIASITFTVTVAANHVSVAYANTTSYLALTCEL